MESRGRCGHPRERGGGLVYLCLMLTGYCYNICIWFDLLASDPVKKKELPRKMMRFDGVETGLM